MLIQKFLFQKRRFNPKKEGFHSNNKKRIDLNLLLKFCHIKLPLDQQIRSRSYPNRVQCVGHRRKCCSSCPDNGSQRLVYIAAIDSNHRIKKTQR